MIINDDSTHDDSTRTLPLWKHVVEEMLKSIAYGATYPVEFFEQGLKAHRDTVVYRCDFQKIRDSLLKRGYMITTRGQKVGALIRHIGMNAAELKAFSRKSMRALTRGFVLGTNTPLTLLTVEERRRHEAALEKVAMRHALMQHSVQAGRLITKHAPKLLTGH